MTTHRAGRWPSRRFALLAFFLLPVIVWGADEPVVVAPDHPPARQPRLVCPEPTFDFGVREPAHTVEHEFILRNEGDAPLQITKVKPTCGCTVADWTKKLLRPGEEARLKCRLKLTGYRGPQKKSIRIHSNDPSQPIYQVWLTGQVRVEVELQPPFISFSQIPHTGTVTKRTRLMAVGRRVQIVDFSCPSPLFDVRVEKVDDINVDLAITTKPPLPYGTHRTRLVVRTDDEKYPELYLPVIVSVLGEVTVLPKVLYLPKAQPGLHITRSILLRPSLAPRFKIEHVEVPAPDIRATVIPVRAGMQRVELQNIPVSGDLDGKQVTIFTDLPIMKEIQVPFRVAK
jgi:hypothetical protein